MRLAVTIVTTCALLSCGRGVVFLDDEEGSTSSMTSGPDCVPTGDTERCDGLDNDCDGLIDEDIAPVVCGVGRCETIVYCEAGTMPDCTPADPTPEL